MKAVSNEVKKVVNDMFTAGEPLIVKPGVPNKDVRIDDHGKWRGWFIDKKMEDGTKEFRITGKSFFVAFLDRGQKDLVPVLFLVHKNLNKDTYGKLSVWEYYLPMKSMAHARKVIMDLCQRQQKNDERGKLQGRYFFKTAEYNGLPVWKMNRSFIPSTETFEQEIVDVYAQIVREYCDHFNMIAKEFQSDEGIDQNCSEFTEVEVQYFDSEDRYDYSEVRYV